MTTIEEIEEKLNVGINLANDIQKFVTEQENIVRAEERERCIRLAQECVNENWRDWLLGIDRDGMIGFSVDDEQIREWLTNGGK